MTRKAGFRRDALDIHPKVKLPAQAGAVVAVLLIVLAVLEVVPATAPIAVTAMSVLSTALGYIKLSD